MGDNKTHFHSPKQVCMTQLHQMCLITCRCEVHRQEVCQDIYLILIGPGYSGILFVFNK